MVWSPLAGAACCRASTGATPDGRAGQPADQSFDFPPVNRDRAFDCVDVMQAHGRGKRGVSVAQIALAWLLHQKVVTSVIVGAKRVGATGGQPGGDHGGALGRRDGRPSTRSAR